MCLYVPVHTCVYICIYIDTHTYIYIYIYYTQTHVLMTCINKLKFFFPRPEVSKLLLSRAKQYFKLHESYSPCHNYSSSLIRVKKYPQTTQKRMTMARFQ